MNLRRWAACALAWAGLFAATTSAGAGTAAGAPVAAEPLKTLRYAFSAAETGFDPVRVTDLYSRIVTAHLYETPYRYDYLARPAKAVPSTAAAMPEVSDDFKTWTIRLKPGIYFSDDPAFKGKKRELVAEDYVYSWKRFFDPANKSSSYSNLAEEGMLGVDELRQEALRTRKPFDYDRPVPGLKAIDRYTVQVKLAQPRPRFIYTICDASLFGAVAREVVEHYGEQSSEHPVGTGPFRLAAWRRSSLITLERSPSFHEVLYDGEPAAGDAEGQALLKQFKGRRLPMIDRVEVSIIEEGQPRYLAFLNGELDLLTVPLEFSAAAHPGGKLAPSLARKGVRLHRVLNPDIVYTYFNMDDPLVGGFAADKVALRRAINLAYDTQREIRDVRRGQATVAQSLIPPHTFGYDTDFKSENGDFDMARAKALLDLYGYVDKDGDGWRDQPDGKPLVLKYASQPGQIYRQFDEVLKKSLDGLGLRIEIEQGQWPEQYKQAQAGKLMFWQLGGTSSTPDAQDMLQSLYGPATGGQNLARFKLPAYDALYERIQALPDGPERFAAIHEAKRLAVAYAPMKPIVHRVVNDLTQPWLLGYRRPLFANVFWQFVDIDLSKRPK